MINQIATLVGTIAVAKEPAVLEEITVRSKPGQDQTITPDEGVDGFSQITVRRTPLITKTITPTTQAQTFRASDDDAQGYSQVTVGAMNLQQKTITPTSQQQVVVPDQGWDGMSSVTVEAVVTDLANVTMQADRYGEITGFKNLEMNVTIDGTVGSGVDITTQAFKDCFFLKTITCSDNVTRADGQAFYNCRKLTTARFPGLTYFEPYTFYGCQILKHLYLGYNGVVSIGMGSGDICQGHDTDTTWDDSGTLYVHVPADQLANYQADTDWQTAIAAATSAGYTLTLVGDYA